MERKCFDFKENKILAKWQLNIIQRLPTSRTLKEQILKEEYGVDWDGNYLVKQREVVNVKRKKAKTKVDDSIFKNISGKEQEDTIITDA